MQKNILNRIVTEINHTSHPASPYAKNFKVTLSAEMVILNVLKFLRSAVNHFTEKRC